MALPKQKFREIVFELLYSHDFSESQAEDMIPFLMNHHEVPKSQIREAQSRLSAILAKQMEIDGMIAAVCDAYSFERISRVERNLLRLGCFELLFDETIPPKVAIAEAMRLCKKFSTPEGAHFVNAIIDKFNREKAQHDSPVSAG